MTIRHQKHGTKMSMKQYVGQQASNIIYAIGNSWESIAEQLHHINSEYPSSQHVKLQCRGNEKWEDFGRIFLRLCYEQQVLELDFINAIKAVLAQWQIDRIIAALNNEGNSDIIKPGVVKVPERNIAECKKCGCQFWYNPNEIFGRKTDPFYNPLEEIYYVRCKQQGCNEEVKI